MDRQIPERGLGRREIRDWCAAGDCDGTRAHHSNVPAGYERLPAHMRTAVRLYVETGRRPGTFLVALLCNNLVLAVQRADPANLDALPAWVCWLWNECPGPAWGSSQAVAEWEARGGLAGPADIPSANAGI